MEVSESDIRERLAKLSSPQAVAPKAVPLGRRFVSGVAVGVLVSGVALGAFVVAAPFDVHLAPQGQLSVSPAAFDTLVRDYAAQHDLLPSVARQIVSEKLAQ